MKQVYAAIFTLAPEGGYTVFIPDLNINTQGDNIAETIEMARDAICMWAICEEDMGHTIPIPTTISPEHADGETIALIDVDFAAYRRAQETRTIRKNVTLPSWLNDLGEKEGLNFSQVLQEGLKSRLHVEGK